jgi:hypothetical protein
MKTLIVRTIAPVLLIFAVSPSASVWAQGEGIQISTESVEVVNQDTFVRDFIDKVKALESAIEALDDKRQGLEHRPVAEWPTVQKELIQLERQTLDLRTTFKALFLKAKYPNEVDATPIEKRALARELVRKLAHAEYKLSELDRDFVGIRSWISRAINGLE